MAESQSAGTDHLIALRRDLHRHPEPAWCEFYTTARLIEAIERVGVDRLHVGRDALGDDRLAVPDEETLERWYQRALDDGADPSILEELRGGWTGAIAVLERGEGPVVGLRVDIDALPRDESDDPDHRPVAEGFRSGRDGMMHACGHDAHAAIGVGVLEAVKASDFEGTLKVFFQPAEERIGGGKPMARSGHLDDLDALLAVHVGLDHPTGEVVCGVDGFLAVSHFRAAFEGTAAHAGGSPQDGRNAVQAAATAIQNLYAIPRHDDGPTRINAGIMGGGTATNIIPEDAFVEGEVRGGTTDLMEYTRRHADRMLRAAAEMHDCSVEIHSESEAPSATSDQGLVDLLAEVAPDVAGVDTVLERDELGGSEDATFLMDRVQDRGGLACYLGVGTDHPGGHHSATFDVDETSIRIGVDWLAGAIESIGRGRLNLDGA
jgi:aminobenzoyl-glutamate utilization protein A